MVRQGHLADSVVEAASPPASVSQRPDGYVYGLDLVRFATALIVTFYHLTRHDPRITHPALFGWVGVQIFFVISGIVIANSAAVAKPWPYVKGRILRLYPAVWVVAPASLIAILAYNGFDQELPFNFLRSMTLSPVGPWLASAYWTLPIEVAFYVLVLVVLRLGQMARIERVAIGLAFYSLAYLTIYGLHLSGVIHLSHIELGTGAKDMTLLRHGVFFALGIFAWLWSVGRLSRLGLASAFLATIGGCVEIAAKAFELAGKLRPPIDLRAAWLIPVLIWLAACALMLGALNWRAAVAKMPQPILRSFRAAGLATYPLYLSHEALGLGGLQLLITAGASPWLSVIATASGLIVFALLVALVVEPLIRGGMRKWFSTLEKQLASCGARIATKRDSQPPPCE